MTQQATHSFLECREPCVHQPRDQWSMPLEPPVMEWCCSQSGWGTPRWQHWFLLILGCSPLPAPQQHRGKEQQTCRMSFLLDILHFELSPLLPLQKAVGRREGTPGLQISIKGLVRGLWGHLLVLFSLFTPALILGVLIKSVINVKIFYRPIKVPKQK